MGRENWARSIKIGAIVSFALLLQGIWFLAAPEPGYGHLCIVDPDESSEEALLRYFEEYDSVFLGRVTGSRYEYPDPEDAEIISDGVGIWVYKFEVTGVFKGRVKETVYLTTSEDFPWMSQDETYLIFADAPQYYLGLCNPSSKTDLNEGGYIRRGRDYFDILSRKFPGGPLEPAAETSLPTPTPMPTFTATPMPTPRATATSTPTPRATATSTPLPTPIPTPAVTPTEVSVSPTIPPAHTPTGASISSDSGGCGLSAATDPSTPALMLGLLVVALRSRRPQ